MKWKTGLLALLMIGGAQAGVVEDQQMIAWSSGSTLAIGGGSEQKIAQTFTAGLSGTLDHLTLALSCSDSSTGSIHVEIHAVDAAGVPDGIVLASTSLAANTVHMDPIALGYDVPMSGPVITAGTQYAIVLRTDAGVSCATVPGPCATCFFNYPDGNAFFDARPNPPGWVPMNPAVNDDIPFRTWVDVPEPRGPRFCDFRTADGVPNDWILNDVPLCGCVTDSVLAYNRCWFATPDLVLWRDMPLPWERPSGKSRWTLLPHTLDLGWLTASEFDENGAFVSRPVEFSRIPTNQPMTKASRYRGVTESTLVKIEYDNGEDIISLVFETYFEGFQDQ